MEELGNIAVFLAGWNSEYQTRLINGIIRKAKEANYAISIFTCQAGSEISDKHVLGENKIYSLANLTRIEGETNKRGNYSKNTSRWHSCSKLWGKGRRLKPDWNR